MLPITIDHASAIDQLPDHHRDPFDRMLVVQAQLERATLVSGDPAVQPYGVPVVW
jgi:PIN domain nuclease of toxin-antitoxin system